jgi:hypothetical protein
MQLGLVTIGINGAKAAVVDAKPEHRGIANLEMDNGLVRQIFGGVTHRVMGHMPVTCGNQSAITRVARSGRVYSNSGKSEIPPYLPGMK